jgi:hypothetical protein
LDLSLDGLDLSQVPLLYQLFKTDIYLEASCQASRHLRKAGSIPYQTVVTPKVYALSMLLFQQQFKLVRPHQQGAFASVQLSSHMGEIHDASPIIEWIGSPSTFSTYSAVKIGKTRYKVCYLDQLLFAFNLILFNIARRSCNCASWRRP